VASAVTFPSRKLPSPRIATGRSTGCFDASSNIKSRGTDWDPQPVIANSAAIRGTAVIAFGKIAAFVMGKSFDAKRRARLQ
jgi:hypothetical protein